MSLFHKEKHNRLYYIEINDEEIDKHISEIIIQIHTKIHEFKDELSQIAPNKEERLQDLYRLMLDLKAKVQHLRKDVDTVTNMELRNKDFFVIKDESYLQDKKTQLEDMLQAMQSFLSIVEAQPSTQVLKDELINELLTHLNRIIEGAKHIIADDYHLRTIYKRLLDV